MLLRLAGRSGGRRRGALEHLWNMQVGFRQREYLCRFLLNLCKLRIDSPPFFSLTHGISMNFVDSCLHIHAISHGLFRECA